MGILRFEDIEAEVRSNRLIHDWVHSSIQPASYDLRVGTIFSDGKIVNPHHSLAGDPVTIEPGELISFFTFEELELPADIMATVFPMNKWSAQGLLVLNPGHVDPGYKGPLTIKAVNFRKVPIKLSIGEAIFTCIFERMNAPTAHPYRTRVDRTEKEREFDRRESELSSKSIGQLLGAMAQADQAAFESIVQKQLESTWAQRYIDERVRNHRSTFWLLVLTGGATVAGILAVVVTLFTLARPEPTTSNAATPSSIIIQPSPAPPASPPAPATLAPAPSAPAQPPQSSPRGGSQNAR